MTLEAKVGVLASPASTGNQSTTGVGFPPKVLLLWGVNRTSDGAGAGSVFHFGMAVSATARVGLSCTTRDNATATDKYRRHANSKCISALEVFGSTLEEADLVSFDADGFTLNWTKVVAGAYRFGYLALGGDLSSADLKQITSPTSTGTQGYTGIGFEPDALVSVTIGHSAVPPATGADANALALGFAAGPLKRAACGVSAATDDSANRVEVQTSFIRALDPFGSDLLAADVESFDSGGYTLDWTTVDASGRYCWVLALAGGRFAVGSAEQKPSTGTRATTGVGFEPRALLAQSCNNVKSPSIEADYRHTLGAAAGTTERYTAWHAEQDGAEDAVADRSNESDEFLQMLTEGAPTLNAEADLDSFDPNGFTLNWTTADAVLREFVFLAFGDALSTSPQAFQLAPESLNPTGDLLIWELAP